MPSVAYTALNRTSQFQEMQLITAGCSVSWPVQLRSWRKYFQAGAGHASRPLPKSAETRSLIGTSKENPRLQHTLRSRHLHKKQQEMLWHPALSHRAIQKLILCVNGSGLEPSQQHHSPRRLCEQFPNSHCREQGLLNPLICIYYMHSIYILNHCAASNCCVYARYLDAATY